MPSDPYPEWVGLAQGREESPGSSPGDRPHDLLSVSSTGTHTNGVIKETVITSTKFIHFSIQLAKIANDKIGIRATDATLGLRRLPGGFYTIVRHSGLEWRTENKRSSANHDVVEWSGPVPM